MTTQWRKSSFSANGNCLEIREHDGNVQMRDSKAPDGPVLTFTRAEWDAFMDGVLKGEFDEFAG